jgi:hypothetical protein
MSHYKAGVADMRERYVRDLIERVVWTWLQAFGATLIISDFFNVDNVTDVSILEQAALAGVAAVLALIKGLVATKVGSPYTAATLPAKAETPDP